MASGPLRRSPVFPKLADGRLKTHVAKQGLNMLPYRVRRKSGIACVCRKFTSTNESLVPFCCTARIEIESSCNQQRARC